MGYASARKAIGSITEAFPPFLPPMTAAAAVMSHMTNITAALYRLIFTANIQISSAANTAIPRLLT